MTLRGQQQSQTVYHSCKPRIPKGPAPPAELNAELNGVPAAHELGTVANIAEKEGVHVDHGLPYNFSIKSCFTVAFLFYGKY